MKDPKKHLRILGYLHMVIGLIYAIPALLLLISIIFGAPDIISEVMQGEFQSGSSDWAYFVFYTLGALVFTVISIFNIIFGKALTNYKPWATKIVGYIIGVLNLFSFPIGTAIGIYLIWTLVEYNKTMKLNNIR